MKCNTDSYKFNLPLVVCCGKALAHRALGHWVCYGSDKDEECSNEIYSTIGWDGIID